jgi:hypothetical protein
VVPTQTSAWQTKFEEHLRMTELPKNLRSTEMMSRWYKQMSATGQRTENTVEKLTSSKQETAAKLARAEFEQEQLTTFSITSSPREIKHMRLYQHSETVPDRQSCRWAEASQLTEVFHSNPD